MQRPGPYVLGTHHPGTQRHGTHYGMVSGENARLSSAHIAGRIDPGFMRPVMWAQE
jgi:hypothetical protein